MGWSVLSCVVFAIFLSIKAEPVVSSPPEDKSLSPDPPALYNSGHKPDNHHPLRDFVERKSALVEERVNGAYSDLKEMLKEGDSRLKERIDEGLQHAKEERKEGDERLKEELDEDVDWLKARMDKRQRQTEDEVAEGEAETSKEITELKKAVGKLRDNVEQWTQLDRPMMKDLKQQQQIFDFRSELNSTNQQMSDFRSELNSNNQQMSDFRSELDSTNQQMSDFRSELDSNNQQMSDFRSELDSNNQQMSDFQQELNSTKQQIYAATEMMRSLNVSVAAKQASFRAVLENPQVAANAPIPFGLDFVVGDGDYDLGTGVYTAAIPGVYSLGFQLFPQSPANYHVDMFITGTIAIRSRSHNSANYRTSCGASSVFRLRRGDRVWVQTQHTGAYWPGYHSYFFGALLSPEP
ncbi:uncharacterized protein LOC143302118 [Babylonia areolata]|uniref:uncharacterized protein LOC143302118 n=1 Tax=Babylonia areolata TaxID=304850 RepID=UPI003FD6B68F